METKEKKWWSAEDTPDETLSHCCMSLVENITENTMNPSQDLFWHALAQKEVPIHQIHIISIGSQQETQDKNIQDLLNKDAAYQKYWRLNPQMAKDTDEFCKENKSVIEDLCNNLKKNYRFTDSLGVKFHGHLDKYRAENGFGTYTYPDGVIYTGPFKDG